MKINDKDFRVDRTKKVRLAHWSTQIEPLYTSKEDYQDVLAEQSEKLDEMQQLLYASNRYSLLVIFQAMDAAGKDGAIRHVMSGVNPQGCQVFSFKHPSATELDHDYLWRTTQCLPERGRIGIFNRSYYEEVLITRVHPEILSGQNIPKELVKGKDIWENRYHSIREHEKHLSRNGTKVIKFFLHLSKEEQRKRLIERIDNPHKNWKFSISDAEERKHWKEYWQAYEACLGATSTKSCPWFVVPADDKLNARLIVSSIIVDTLSRLKMHYPQPDEARLQELQLIREQL